MGRVIIQILRCRVGGSLPGPGPFLAGAAPPRPRMRVRLTSKWKRGCVASMSLLPVLHGEKVRMRAEADSEFVAAPHPNPLPVRTGRGGSGGSASWQLRCRVGGSLPGSRAISCWRGSGRTVSRVPSAVFFLARLRQDCACEFGMTPVMAAGDSYCGGSRGCTIMPRRASRALKRQ